MSKSKDGAKPLSDKELDKASGGATVHESLDKRIEEAELEKVSGGADSDPRRDIGSDTLDPRRPKG